MEIWNAFNNLQKICTVISNTLYMKRMIAMDEHRKAEDDRFGAIWDPQIQPAALGNTLSPMISTRSTSKNLLTKAQDNHQRYLQKCHPPSSRHYRPLSLQFPALTIEIKLDGERMIVHIKDGRVMMNTRNSKWYSELYSPLLGPSLRRSLVNYSNLDVILDGEIESWDNKNKTLVPFGENRTVAGYRRAFLKHEGLIDPRDIEKFHDENDVTVIRTASGFYSDRSTSFEVKVERGKNLWLKFVTFDVLYVDGPDKNRLFQSCGFLPDIDKDGSIINLPLLRRKQLLYEVLEVQENEVEVCPTRVIRCNGDCVSGEEYFSASHPLIERGFHATLLDSTEAILKNKVDNLESIDNERQRNKTTEINTIRAQAIDTFYKMVVEDFKFEGIVLKDLASPYLFGIRKFWWKFKPDYESDQAVDIDVVILGATFATGIRNGGAPSGYLVGVVDKNDCNVYMTLNNINAASVNKEKMEAIWSHTGFKRGDDGNEMELGKWFREENYALPSFVSDRSFQRNSKEDLEGWKFSKNNTYPDLWINPLDSVVLTIMGQELVLSEEHSVGLSLRFPRIKKIRLESVDGDEKSPTETTTDEEIWRIYSETMKMRLGVDLIIGSQNDNGTNRFWTPERYARSKDKKRKKRVLHSPARKISKVDVIESQILEGLTFCVLEGRYELDETSYDGQQGKKEGWAANANQVRQAEDVITFIKKHGGTFVSTSSCSNPNEYIIGGKMDDARVKNYIGGLEYMRNTRYKKKEDSKSSSLVYHKGILKWTYVYFLVHHAQQQDDNIESVLKSKIEIFAPEPQHYLVRTSAERMEEGLFTLNRPISIDEMERSLDYDGGKRHHWQLQGVEKLQENDRWILASRYTSFWPYNCLPDNKSHSAYKKIVVYPDIFNSYGLISENEAQAEIFEDSVRWNEVRKDSDGVVSILPLVRLMGGTVSLHLHTGVTHVICDLINDIETSTESVSFNLFSCQNRGKRLMSYLKGGLFEIDAIKLISAFRVRAEITKRYQSK